MPPEEVIITDTPVTVDAQTAEDRGDNFVPNDDPVTFDTEGNLIPPDAAAAAAAAAAAPAPTPAATSAAPGPAPAPAPGATAAADEGEELARQNGGLIPKGRFNEVNNARKHAEADAAALRAENERLKAAQTAPSAPAPAAAPAAAPAPAAPQFDVAAQERAYADALLDGDTDKAMKIRGEINDHLLSTAEERASVRVRAEMTQQQTATALQEASDQAVADYPFLNTPEGATALRVITATRDAYISDGMKPHLALKQAVADVAPRFAPPAGTPTRELPATTAPTDTRTAEAIRRGAADSNLQPPAIVNGIGNRATQGRIDPTTMTEAEFDQLPDAEKKKLRGD